MMLKRLSLLLAIVLAATQASADSMLSNLSAGSSVSGTDLFYDVKTPGSGGVKVTATQISTYLWGLVGGDCTASAGTFTCTKTNGSSFGTFATQSAPTGSTQCLHANSSGVVSGTGSDCGSGGGAVSSVTNSDGTLTISPTTGSVVASLAGGHANTWTAAQTFTNSDIVLLGSSTGATTFTSANSGASNFTITVPAATDTLTGRATTDTLTNKTYDTAGTGNVFKINGTQITAISGNTGKVATTTGTLTSTHCVEIDASGNLEDAGATCGGAGGSPGGSNTQVQFNSSGSFAGDSGFTYAGSGQATLALGTITANAKALNITGTWNNSGITFDAPLFMNIVNTASNSSSLLADFQAGSSTQFAVTEHGDIYIGGTQNSGTGAFLDTSGGNLTIGTSGNNVPIVFWISNNTQAAAEIDGQGRFIVQYGVNFVNSGNANGTISTTLYNDAASATLALSNVTTPTTASAFRVYNTTDNVATGAAPTNYERGVFDWTTTSNTLTIGTQNGGTGSSRGIAIAAGGTNAITISSAHLVALPAITTDSTHTDATVCEDTTSHALYFGSGTAGICLGTSSLRYKHDVSSLNVGLDQIMALEPISYKLNADHGDPNKLLYGFSAEQGGNVLPHLMTTDDAGRPNTFDYLGVIPVLVRAIQQQQAEIDQLKRHVR